MLSVVRILPLHTTQLDQHHNEHDTVEEKDDAEIGNNGDIEGNVIFQPAAVGETWIRFMFVCPYMKVFKMEANTYKSSLVPLGNLP